MFIGVAIFHPRPSPLSPAVVTSLLSAFANQNRLFVEIWKFLETAISVRSNSQLNPTIRHSDNPNYRNIDIQPVPRAVREVSKYPESIKQDLWRFATSDPSFSARTTITAASTTVLGTGISEPSITVLHSKDKECMESPPRRGPPPPSEPPPRDITRSGRVPPPKGAPPGGARRARPSNLRQADLLALKAKPSKGGKRDADGQEGGSKREFHR